MEVIKKNSNNLKTRFLQPIRLHETSKRSVDLICFYIPHSGYEDLAIKIVTKLKSPPPNDWLESEEKSLSLDANATKNLVEALNGALAVVDSEKLGKYMILRLDEGTANYSGGNESKIARIVASLLSNEKVASQFGEILLEQNVVDTLSSSLSLNRMRAAIAELRQLLDEEQSREEPYQKWCERHSWAFGNSFVLSDDVRQISATDKVDLLVPNTISGYRDIIELKRPDMEVLIYDSSHRNFYFSSDVSKAIGQVHRYIDVFQENAKTGLLDHEEVVAYYPRATIVIGRSTGWDAEKRKSLHGLNARLHNIQIITYDQLLLQGQRMLDLLFVPADDEDSEVITVDPTEDF